MRRYSPPISFALTFAMAVFVSMSLLGPSANMADTVSADGPDQPMSIDVGADGTVWLALGSDTVTGGAHQLTADLKPLSGFASSNLSTGIAIDSAGNVLLLESLRPPAPGDRTSIAVYSADGLHQKSWAVDGGPASNMDAASEARSAWTLFSPTTAPPGMTPIPEAARYDDGVRAVGGYPTDEDARRIAGSPDGSFYVASDRTVESREIRRFSAEGALLSTWTIEHPILAIDVNEADGALWVASLPPPLPDLSKTRIQRFAPDGGTPPGTASADFEMDVDAIDIAAGSQATSSGVTCSVYGIGSFGIGALWTIARHDCDGTPLETSRDIPQVSVWTPVPTATTGPVSTPTFPSTPTIEPPTTETPGTPPTPGATPSSVPSTGPPTITTVPSTLPPPSSVPPPFPSATPEPIYLPLALKFAARADLHAATAAPTAVPTITETPFPTSSTPTTEPFDTPEPTAGPTSEATPTPVLESAVIIQLAHGAGFSIEQVIGGLPSQSPWFTLYEDGTVLRRTSAYNWMTTTADDTAISEVRDGIVTRPGFFDLPESNFECGITDIGATFVHASETERSHTVSGEGLEMYASDGCISVPAGTTYDQWRALANGIGDARTRSFGPEIGWVPARGTLAVSRNSFGDAPRPWSVPGVSLADIAPTEDLGYGTLAIEGDTMTAVLAEMATGGGVAQSYSEGGVQFTVGLRVEFPGWDAYSSTP